MPFKGPRRRQGSCWKEQTRTIFTEEDILYKSKLKKRCVRGQTWLEAGGLLAVLLSLVANLIFGLETTLLTAFLLASSSLFLDVIEVQKWWSTEGSNSSSQVCLQFFVVGNFHNWWCLSHLVLPVPRGHFLVLSHPWLKIYKGEHKLLLCEHTRDQWTKAHRMVNIFWLQKQWN